tara:strand:+ start:1482 stop:1670 length:189 start_codon:yes stop_codon:yes gene_type:complete
MKANFKINKNEDSVTTKENTSEKNEELTEEEFEEYMSKAGAVGSFMVFRSNSKKDELGIDSL